jgi:hypothetical protein
MYWHFHQLYTLQSKSIAVLSNPPMLAMLARSHQALR